MDFAGKQLLIVAPHPDDEAIGCGGLINVAKRHGCRIFVLFVAVGASRQLVTGQTEPDTRLQEAQEASVFGGYEYEFCFVGNRAMRLDAVPQKELVDRIEDVYVRLSPTMVVLPFSGSYDQDHRAVFTAGMAALRPVPESVRHRTSWVLECEEPYTWSVDQGFKPNLYIELSVEDLEFKKGLLGCHKTQVRQAPFARSFENLSRLAGMRGTDIGVPFAEGYRLLRGILG